VPPTLNATSNHSVPGPALNARQARRGGVPRPSRNPSATNLPSSETRVANAQKSAQERKSTSNIKTPSQASSSRPSTPASSLAPPRAATPAESKTARQKQELAPPLPPQSPAPSTTAGSDSASASQDFATSPKVLPENSPQLSLPRIPDAPPGLPAVPPGLSAPPGIPSPSRPPRFETASPQTPLLASQSSYQMSTAARALLDDVKARRESTLPTTIGQSPFPDFDRTLQTLSGGDGGGFSFNLDPALAGSDVNQTLVDFEAEASAPFRGTYVDAFPALRIPASSAFMAPPGLPYPHHPNRSIYDPLPIRPSPTAALEKQLNGNSGYMGSFNPFADGSEDLSAQAASPPNRSQYSPLDDDPSRKVSRFGFARGRQGSTATSSPLHAPSPLSHNNGDVHSFYNSMDGPPQSPSQAQWGRQDQGYIQPSSAMGSPLVQHMQPAYTQPQIRFQPFDSGVSEAQLRDFIQFSRDRANSSNDTTNTPAGKTDPSSIVLPGFDILQFSSQNLC
jgi:CCR4-NOT transcription complex subunit 4